MLNQLYFNKVSLVAQTVKNLHTMQETSVQSLGGKDFPGEGNTTHSSILSGRIPCTEEPGRLQSMGLQKSTGLSHNWATNTFIL